MEAKISVSISLPGRVLMNETECKANNNYRIEKIELWNPKKKKREIITTSLRGSIPAKQVINLNGDSYKYMTAKSSIRKEDSKNTPSFSTPAIWFQLSKKERLKAHLQNIAESLGGTLLDYTILDD